MDEVIQLADFVAVAVFAISGALAAGEQKQDILGFVLFGTITGVGGGTVRDLLLDTDAVFWIADTRYLWICMLSAAATWFLAPMFRSLHMVLLWADAVGLALFSVLGANKAMQWGAPPVVAVVMGMMTASFGSLIRDTLLNQKPVLLEPEIYVSAALLGAASYVAIHGVGGFESAGMLIAMALAFLLRGSAIVFGLKLPKFGN